MAARREIPIGLVQMRCTADPAHNLAAARDAARDAASRGARIICLPELFLSPYFCQTEDHAHFALAEPIPGPTTEALQETARDLDAVIIASLFERRAPGLYHNSAAIIDADGALLGVYRKMHIPDDPLYFEKFYFTPGDTGFKAWQTRHAKIGVCICWDQWYPEAARLTALHGAEILFYPTAIGWHPSEKADHGPAQHDAWETMQRAHAIANGVFIAAVNRTGHERANGGDGIEFWGGSFLCDPAGRIVARAAHDTAATLVASADLDRIDEQRTHWPFLRDRRIDAYPDIGRRFID